MVGYREYGEQIKKYHTVFRVSNLEKIPEEIKEKFLDIENYNCLTGNSLLGFTHKYGENRWIALADINRYNIKIKDGAQARQLQAAHIEEGKLYKAPITYYNLSDLKISQELEQKFVPRKENTVGQLIGQQKENSKNQDKGNGIGE